MRWVYLLPILPLSPQDPTAPRSLFELVPHFLDESYAPAQVQLVILLSGDKMHLKQYCTHAGDIT